MDEVDKIIILSLKDIGCNIDEDIQCLEQFSTEIVVQAAGKCLKIIQPELDIPESLPQNMAARFHLGSSIAQACKGLGYNGDVGYQTFLYSNVVDIRRVFMFLIEKLPREVEKPYLEPDDPVSKLLFNMGKEIRRRLDLKINVEKTFAIPFISVPLETGIVAPGAKLKQSPKEWREYVINSVPFITEQTTSEHFLPSAIVLNTKGLLGCSEPKSTDVLPHPQLYQNSANTVSNFCNTEETWLTITESLLYSKEENAGLNSASNVNIHNNLSSQHNENELKTSNEPELEIVNEDPLNKIRINVDELQIRVKEQQGVLDKIKEDCKRELLITNEKSKEIELLEKSLSLLPESEVNLKKIKDSIKVMAEKILSLSSRWESYRKPLIDKYMGARSKMANRESQNEDELEKMKQLKGKIELLNKQLVMKRGIIAQLEEEYDKLPKNINRSAYTRRIMEIIGNIKKQKDEIEKILKDTKDLQKEINTLNGRLERLFTVTEEKMFRNTKKDEFSKRAFNLLTTLHSDCSSIGSLALEIGTISREITDLREQIEIESNKNTTANLERITADLEQMKAESTSLTNQIKKLESFSDVHSHPLL